MDNALLDSITTACRAAALTLKLQGEYVPKWLRVNEYETPGYVYEPTIRKSLRVSHKYNPNGVLIIARTLAPYLPPFETRGEVADAVYDSIDAFIMRQAYRREHKWRPER